MKRMTLFIIGCMFFTIQAAAQHENNPKIPPKDKRPITLNPLDKPLNPLQQQVLLFMPTYQALKNSLDTARHTLHYVRLVPMDEHLSGASALHKRWFFYAESDRKNYLNLASYNLAYFALGWRLSGKLQVMGGLLAMKQFTNTSLHGVDRAGVRFRLNYALTNQVDFNIWGEYITGSTLDTPVDNLLPQSVTGTSMTLNLGGGSQLGVGTEYRKDEKKGSGSYHAAGKLKLNF